MTMPNDQDPPAHDGTFRLALASGVEVILAIEDRDVAYPELHGGALPFRLELVRRAGPGYASALEMTTPASRAWLSITDLDDIAEMIEQLRDFHFRKGVRAVGVVE